MSLRDAIRAGVLKTPVQPTFSEAVWHDAFRQLAGPSEEDTRIYEGGCFFAGQLQGLRRLLQAHPAPEGTTAELVRRTVAVLNVHSSKLRALGRGAPDGKVLLLPDMIERQIPLAGGGGSATSSEIIESLIDGARFELAELRRTPSTRGTEEDQSAIQRLVLRGNLSLVYHMLGEQWLECLHHGFGVASSDECTSFAPFGDREAAIAHAIGQYRQHAIDFEIAHGLSEFVEELGMTMALVKDAKKDAGFQELLVGERLAWNVHIGQMLAQEPDLESSLTTTVHLASGLTIGDLLQVWGALAPLGDPARELRPDDPGPMSLPELDLFAPIFDIARLGAALERCCRMSSDKCTAALNALTWTGERDSLWHRPLVPLDNQTVVVVDAALGAPNLRRSVEQWLSIVPNELSSRGGRFETHVREELSASVKENPLLTDAGVVLERLRPFDAHVGDIDLLAWIADTVLVGEVKCLRRPATSHEWFQQDDTLSKAVTQAKRKAAWIRSNPAWLEQQIGRSFTTVSVEPCVVVNAPASSLRVIQSVPIVDVLILNRYLRDGFGQMYATLRDRSDAEQLWFYHDNRSASEALGDYLRAPKHLMHYRESINWGRRNQPDFQAEGKVVVAVFPKVKAKLPQRILDKLNRDG